VEQWQQVWQNNGLARGIGMRSGTAMFLTFDDVLERLPGVTRPNFNLRDVQRSVAELSYTASTKANAESSFTKSTANFSSPWVSASAERNTAEQRRGGSASTSAYITGKYMFPRVAVSLQGIVQPRSAFVEAVRGALLQPTGQPRIDALHSVFDRFGHAYVTKATLGGSLHHTLTQQLAHRAVESREEIAVAAALQAKVVFYQGGASHAQGKAAEQRNNYSERFDSVALTAIGGNTLAVSSPAQMGVWVTSVGDPRNWRVISYDELAPTTDLLPPDLKRAVEAVVAQQALSATPQPAAAPPPTPMPFEKLSQALSSAESSSALRCVYLFHPDTGFWLNAGNSTRKTQDCPVVNLKKHATPFHFQFVQRGRFILESANSGKQVYVAKEGGLYMCRCGAEQKQATLELVDDSSSISDGGVVFLRSIYHASAELRGKSASPGIMDTGHWPTIDGSQKGARYPSVDSDSDWSLAKVKDACRWQVFGQLPDTLSQKEHQKSLISGKEPESYWAARLLFGNKRGN
jgi:hypothetical protein